MKITTANLAASFALVADACCRVLKSYVCCRVLRSSQVCIKRRKFAWKQPALNSLPTRRRRMVRPCSVMCRVETFAQHERERGMRGTEAQFPPRRTQRMILCCQCSSFRELPASADFVHLLQCWNEPSLTSHQGSRRRRTKRFRNIEH